MLATAFYEDPLTLFIIAFGLMILFFWYFATEIERRKRNIGTILLIGVVGLCIVAATPPRERLKGGIDILGGSAFSLRIQEREMDDGSKQEVTKEQVEQAINVIEKRLNGMIEGNLSDFRQTCNHRTFPASDFQAGKIDRPAATTKFSLFKRDPFAVTNHLKLHDLQLVQPVLGKRAASKDQLIAVIRSKYFKGTPLDRSAGPLGITPSQRGV